MKKALLGVAAAAGAGLLLLFVLSTRGGPRGDPASSALDYPLEAGLTWTYRGAAKVAVVRRVERPVEIDGRRYFEMKYELPILGTRVIPMRHAPGGVFTAREGREFLLVRLPMAKGEGWTVDVPGEKEIADCTVLGDEEIEFGGKRGVATKVEVRRRRRDSGTSWTDYEWYARGVGLVRMQVTLGLQATFVLESFERAK